MNSYKSILVSLVLTACLISFSSFNILGQAYANNTSNDSNINKFESSATLSDSTASEVSEVLVKYKDGKASDPSIDSALSKEDSTLEKVKIEEDTDLNSLMDKYRNDPDVESVQPNYVYKSFSVNDPYRSKQWGLDVIQADTAWASNTSMGEGVTVAIVDSGIDLDHEDLAANIIGGHGVISPDVESKIKDMGIQCTRIYGSNRYETSLAIANYLGSVEGAFIASGESFADALSVSSLAACLNYPILLTEKNNLPSGISGYIQSKGISKSYVIGGTGVISDDVLYKIPNSQRIYGSNRYDTNIKVLEAFKDNLNIENVYLATGENYPDALSGSILASLTDSPLVLASPYAGSMTKKYIRMNK